MPDNDKLVTFDRKREILLSMAETIERASGAQLEELVAQLVERAETVDRRVSRILWIPPARPFFLRIARPSSTSEVRDCGAPKGP